LLEPFADDALAGSLHGAGTYLIPLGSKNIITHFLLVIADIPMQPHQLVSLSSSVVLLLLVQIVQ